MQLVAESASGSRRSIVPERRRRSTDGTDHRARLDVPVGRGSAFGPDAWFTNFDAGVFTCWLSRRSRSSASSSQGGRVPTSTAAGGTAGAGQLIAYGCRWCSPSSRRHQAGSMNLRQIVVAQNTQEISVRRARPAVRAHQFVGFIIFMIAIRPSSRRRRSTCRSPIRLVSGYMTEYSGFRFLIFFIGEFATAGVFAFIAAGCSSAVGVCRSAGSAGTRSTASTTG